jgi:hypothetical protein
MLTLFFLAALPLVHVAALNFGWEREQLTESEALTDNAYRFGTANAKNVEDCRFIPGDDEWPSDEDWAALNTTLGGALLRPKPLGSVCYFGPEYNAARCEQLRQGWTSSKLQ